MKLPATLLAFALLGACSSSKDQRKDSAAAAQNDTVIEAYTASPDLPPPYATKSTVNTCEVLGWGENSTPQAPAGFRVGKFAGDLQNPRWIYVLPNGDVLIAETKKETSLAEKAVKKISGRSKAEGDSKPVNRISLFRDTNKDGTPDQRTVFLQELNMPFGMLLLNGWFYVADSDALWRFPYKEGQTEITAPGEKLLDIPESGRHWTRNIVANKAGTKIYIAVGSGSDVAEDGIEKEHRRACILEVNPDGTGERLYGSGLRNPVGMDWAPGTATLWTAVNERDELGDDLVPDYLTSVKDGGFYGWPYSYFGQHLDPRVKEQRPDLVKKAIVPEVQLGAHTASLGLDFYEGKSFPEKYRGGAFIGQHGSWNRSVLSGYKVVFVPFSNGQPSGPMEDFLTGFIVPGSNKQVYGRPVGVTALPDGSLLVADDAGKTVWRVVYEGKK